MWKRSLSLLVLLLSSSFAPAAPKVPPGMKMFEGRYHYIIYDVPDEQAREIAIRMTAMFREYQTRTAGFSGRVQGKLPFYVYTREEDYNAAGGMPGSAGVFMGDKLLACVGNELTSESWHVIQHEGFHQFVHYTMGEQIPQWLNEGLAEYFGEAIYTGDGFVSGVIPAGRLKRIQNHFKQGDFHSLPELLTITNEEWNARLSIVNYDQSWATVQFLAHADDNKYQKGFADYIGAVSRGRPDAQAWRDAIGQTQACEERWKSFWTDLKDTPTADLYAQAVTQMLTSYLARATIAKVQINSIDELLAAIDKDQIPTKGDALLPGSLRKDCTGLQGKLVEREYKWTFDPAAKPKAIVCTTPDGQTLRGTFIVTGQRVDKIQVKWEKKPKSPEKQ